MFIITKLTVETNCTEIIKVCETKVESLDELYTYLDKEYDDTYVVTLANSSIFVYLRSPGYLYNSKAIKFVYQIHNYEDNK